MSSGEGDRITLRVKQLSGEEKTITTSLTSTIAELRPIISEVTGIPSDSLRMIFRGRLLQDANTVTQSHLEDNAVIHVVKMKPSSQSTSTSSSSPASTSSSSSSSSTPSSSSSSSFPHLPFGPGTASFSSRARPMFVLNPPGMGSSLNAAPQVFSNIGDVIQSILGRHGGTGAGAGTGTGTGTGAGTGADNSGSGSDSDSESADTNTSPRGSSATTSSSTSTTSSASTSSSGSETSGNSGNPIDDFARQVAEELGRSLSSLSSTSSSSSSSSTSTTSSSTSASSSARPTRSSRARSSSRTRSPSRSSSPSRAEIMIHTVPILSYDPTSPTSAATMAQHLSRAGLPSSQSADIAAQLSSVLSGITGRRGRSRNTSETGSGRSTSGSPQRDSSSSRTRTSSPSSSAASTSSSSTTRPDRPTTTSSTTNTSAGSTSTPSSAIPPRMNTDNIISTINNVLPSVLASLASSSSSNPLAASLAQAAPAIAGPILSRILGTPGASGAPVQTPGQRLQLTTLPPHPLFSTLPSSLQERLLRLGPSSARSILAMADRLVNRGDLISSSSSSSSSLPLVVETMIEGYIDNALQEMEIAMRSESANTATTNAPSSSSSSTSASTSSTNPPPPSPPTSSSSETSGLSSTSSSSSTSSTSSSSSTSGTSSSSTSTEGPSASSSSVAPSTSSSTSSISSTSSSTTPSTIPSGFPFSSTTSAAAAGGTAGRAAGGLANMMSMMLQTIQQGNSSPGANTSIASMVEQLMGSGTPGSNAQSTTSESGIRSGGRMTDTESRRTSRSAESTQDDEEESEDEGPDRVGRNLLMGMLNAIMNKAGIFDIIGMISGGDVSGLDKCHTAFRAAVAQELIAVIRERTAARRQAKREERLAARSRGETVSMNDGDESDESESGSDSDEGEDDEKDAFIQRHYASELALSTPGEQSPFVGSRYAVEFKVLAVRTARVLLNLINSPEVHAKAATLHPQRRLPLHPNADLEATLLPRLVKDVEVMIALIYFGPREQSPAYLSYPPPPNAPIYAPSTSPSARSESTPGFGKALTRVASDAVGATMDHLSEQFEDGDVSLRLLIQAAFQEVFSSVASSEEFGHFGMMAGMVTGPATQMVLNSLSSYRQRKALRGGGDERCLGIESDSEDKFAWLNAVPEGRREEWRSILTKDSAKIAEDIKKERERKRAREEAFGVVDDDTEDPREEKKGGIPPSSEQGTDTSSSRGGQRPLSLNYRLGTSGGKYDSEQVKRMRLTTLLDQEESKRDSSLSSSPSSSSSSSFSSSSSSSLLLSPSTRNQLGNADSTTALNLSLNQFETGLSSGLRNAFDEVTAAASRHSGSGGSDAGSQIPPEARDRVLNAVDKALAVAYAKQVGEDLSTIVSSEWNDVASSPAAPK